MWSKSDICYVIEAIFVLSSEFQLPTMCFEFVFPDSLTSRMPKRVKICLRGAFMSFCYSFCRTIGFSEGTAKSFFGMTT